MLSANLVGPAYAEIVPHHGSATSSSPAWVAAVNPRIAFVSAGPNNRFGHPSPEVVNRYRDAGARTFRTDRDGALFLDLGGGRPRTMRMRDGDWLEGRP